jgi:hypothetical protein
MSNALDSLAHLLSKLELPSEPHKDALWHTNREVNSRSYELLNLDAQGTFSAPAEHIIFLTCAFAVSASVNSTYFLGV